MDKCKLKPCPFCGKVPVMESSDYDPRVTRYVIRCENPKCRIQPNTDYHIYKSVITREWNRRAKDEQIH
jgi:hypothetical protein